jgi:NADPH-dependent 7-cyano-7-deazaguanine reductase QueF
LSSKNLKKQEKDIPKELTEKQKLDEIKREEEKLKFINHLLNSNCRRSDLLARQYDFRDDIAKFMIAKE